MQLQTHPKDEVPEDIHQKPDLIHNGEKDVPFVYHCKAKKEIEHFVSIGSGCPKKRIAVGHPWILVSSSDRGSAVGPLPNTPAKVLPPHQSNSTIQTHPSASITLCRPNALKLVSRVSNTYVKRSVRAKTHHLVVFLRIPGVRGSMVGVGTSFTTSPRMMWVRGKLGNRREIPFSGHFLPVSVPSPAPLLSTLHKMSFIDRVFLLCKAEFSPSKISYLI